ncbi:hypothetical protein NC653_006650 [Populus alba x Populus x berolinensis]|uniref:Uncharacterized protein n=1 Tax=Populus alba x Populus x berolinensis TaxID=444605 RepID=A0AAD6REZ6_9ROSI|nr:hypothetical protein NC653_006650 [Populus alba x Populus x berolinensis]
MGIYDENRIKIVYCDQRRYNSSNPSDSENKCIISLVETLNGDNDDSVMRPHVLGFGHETRVYDMVCNDWSIYHKKNQLVMVIWLLDKFSELKMI